MSKSADAFRTISEVADWLGVQAHVLRFWESKFTQIKPVKRAGGRRYYRPADMLLLGGIRKLLHKDGLSIKEVQTILRDLGVAHVSEMSHDLEAENPEAAPAVEPPKKSSPVAEPAPLPSATPSEQADAPTDAPVEEAQPLNDEAPAVSPMGESEEHPPQEPALAQPDAAQDTTAEDVAPDAPQEEGMAPAPVPSEPDLTVLTQDMTATDSPAAEAPSVMASPAQTDLLPEAPEQDAPPASAQPLAETAPAAAAPSGEDGEEPQQMFMELDTPDAGAEVQEETAPQPEEPALSDFDGAAENSFAQESQTASEPEPKTSTEGDDAQTDSSSLVEAPLAEASAPDFGAEAEGEEESESPWGNTPNTEPSGAEPLAETDTAATPVASPEVEATDTTPSVEEALTESASVAANESASPKPRVIDIPDEASGDTGLATAGVLALLARTTNLPPEVTQEVAHHAAELRAFLATR